MDGEEPGRWAPLVGVALLGAVVLGSAVLIAITPAGNHRPPETFFALRRVGAEIVEVRSGTGRVLRTIVDLGDPGTVERTGGLIDGIALAQDRQALWFSRYLREPGVVYRVQLPDGRPEPVADGHGASVSPDGQRLALIRRADLVVLDLASRQERVFAGIAGELGGVEAVWSGDAVRLALEISAADVSWVQIVDSATGDTTELRPEDAAKIDHGVLAPAYRPGDGLLGVVCCHTGEIVEGEPPDSTNLVLHDPHTGVERSRIALASPARDFDWDASGSHLLVTDGDRVSHYHNGRASRVPGIDDVFAVAW